MSSMTKIPQKGPGRSKNSTCCGAICKFNCKVQTTGRFGGSPASPLASGFQFQFLIFVLTVKRLAMAKYCTAWANSERSATVDDGSDDG
jgi:hypothetical protein